MWNMLGLSISNIHILGGWLAATLLKDLYRPIKVQLIAIGFPEVVAFQFLSSVTLLFVLQYVVSD